MKPLTIRPQAPQIIWKEEKKTLTLTGEPVLEIGYSWPQGDGKGKLVHSINRYYTRLAEKWRLRWEREGYLCACAELARLREQSRPFVPWRASLSGQVTLDNGEFLSIAMQAQESHSDGRALEYRWGDTWRWQDGAPVPLYELFAGEKGWRRRVYQELEQAAEASRRRGIYLYQELEKPLRRWFSASRFALSPEGMELYYPQCTIAPAVEGAPVLLLPLPRGITIETEEEKEA